MASEPGALQMSGKHTRRCSSRLLLLLPVLSAEAGQALTRSEGGAVVSSQPSSHKASQHLLLGALSLLVSLYTFFFSVN